MTCDALNVSFRCLYEMPGVFLSAAATFETQESRRPQPLSSGHAPTPHLQVTGRPHVMTVYLGLRGRELCDLQCLFKKES